MIDCVSGTRLQPWQAALRSFTKSPTFRWQSGKGSESSVVWIGSSNDASAVDSVPLNRVCEALSLLALLLRVDVGAWETEMTAIWPSTQISQQLNTALDAPFAIGLELREPSDGEVRALRCVYDANAVLPTRTSTEYQELRAELEQMLVVDDGDPASVHAPNVPVRIDFSGAMLSDDKISSMFKQALQLITTQHGMQTTSSRSTRRSYSPQFKVVQIDTKTTQRSATLDERGLQLLKQLTNQGVHVTSLPARFVPNPQMPRVASIQAVRSLLSLDASSLVVPGVRSVTITDRDAAHVVPGLLAAIQDSPAVETLRILLGENIDDNDVDYAIARGWPLHPAEPELHERVWSQIAYHVFRRDATHAIQTLELHLAEFQIRYVDAIRSILAQENTHALTHLYGRLDDGVVSRNTATRLSASRFCLEDANQPSLPSPLYPGLKKRGPREMYFQSTQPINVQVIARPSGADGDWTVLLPGYGNAWVHGKDVVRVIEDIASPPTEGDHLSKVFPRIDITTISDASTGAVEGILELIGHSTTHLSVLKCRAMHSIDAWCRQVFIVCPNLNHLDLHRVQLESLQVFVDAATAERCRLRELLAKEVRSGDWRHVRVFFEALSDPSHPLATHLQVLDLRFIVENVNAIEMIESLRQVVQRNRQLTTIHLTFQLSEGFQSVQSELELALAQELEECVWIRDAPLDIRCKLALLSVLENGTNQALCGGLDAGVVATVFQFAAHGHARRFLLTFA